MDIDCVARLRTPEGEPLVLFTANTINPDVPVGNIRAMCEAVR